MPLLSILKNCSFPVTVHILYNKYLSQGHEKDESYNRSCYLKIVEKYGGEIFFHHVDLPCWVNDIPAVKKWTAGTLMRLCLPSLLPDVDKIIYLDCDMIVTTDISNLWNNIDLENKYLAACKDTTLSDFSRKRISYCKKHNIFTENYFCAGTLYLNLKRMREDCFTEKAFSYFRDNQDLPFLDQDILNWFCKGDYIILDEKYNVYYNRPDAILYANDCVIHYADKSKPWKRYGGKIDDYYWQYLLETPWCEDRQTMLNYIRNAPSVERCYDVIQDFAFDDHNKSRRERVKCLLGFINSLLRKTYSGTINYVRRIICE